MPIKHALLLATFPLLAHISAAEAQTSPLTCSYNPPWIECDVTENSVRIRDVKFNRGNCESPVLKGRDREIAEQKYKALSKQQKDELEFKFMPFLLIQKGDPLGKLMIDPTRKEFKFGDNFSVLAIGCPNLIEFTFTVGTMDWTWRTR